MNEINVNDACAMVFLLICIGAFAKLPICIGILTAFILFLYYIVFPVFILWCINVIFGEVVCFIVALLAIGIGIYYYHLGRR